MPTTETYYVNGASSPGGDGTTNATSGANRAFATQAEAEATLQTDLTSADKIYEIFHEGEDTSTNVIWDGWGTDATRYPILTAAEGAGRHPGYWSTSGTEYRLTGSAYSGCMRLRENMIVEFLQVENTYTSATADGPGHGISIDETTETCTVRNCIVKKTGAANNPLKCHGIGADSMFYGSYTCAIYQNIIFGPWNVGIFIWAEPGQSDNINVANNVCVDGILDYGFYWDRTQTGSSSVANIKNNIFDTAGVDYSENSGSNGTSNTASNFTGDSSSPDGASYQSKTATYENEAGDNFLVSTSDTTVLDEGVNLSSSGFGGFEFSTDILGNDRGTTWSAGANEPQDDPGAISATVSSSSSTSASATVVSGYVDIFDVQRGYHDFGASEDTDVATITAFGRLIAGFARNSNTAFTSMGASAGSTSTYNVDDYTALCELTDLDEITFTRPSTGIAADIRCYYETLEYTGDGASDNAMVVRSIATISLADTVATGSVNVSNIVDYTQCVPFICGILSEATGTDGDAAGVRVYIDSSENVQVERGDTTGACDIVVAVVEFSGANWNIQHVQHTFSAAGSAESVSISDISDWSTAFIVSSKEGASGNQGLDEQGWNVWPGSTTTSVRAQLRSGATTPTSHVLDIYVIQNDNLIVDHYDTLTGGETDHPTGASGLDSHTTTITEVANVDTTSLFATSDCAGTGTAYPRFAWSYTLTNSTTVTWERGRGGQPGDWALQVVQWPQDLAPTGTEHAASATVASTSTAAAAASVAREVVATAATTSTASAAASVAREVSSTVASTSTAAAAASVTCQASAAVASSSTLSASAQVAFSASAQVAATSSAAASSAVSIGATVSVSSSGATTAAASVGREVSAAVSSTSTLAASASHTLLVSGTVAASSSLTAVASVFVGIASSVSSSSSLAASSAVAREATSTVSSSSSAGAASTVARPLAATVSAVSALAAALSRILSISITIPAQSGTTAAAETTQDVAISSTVASASTVSASTAVQREVRASVSGNSSTLAAASSTVAASASVSSSSGTTAAAVYASSRSAEVNAQSVFSGTASADYAVTSAVSASTSISAVATLQGQVAASGSVSSLSAIFAQTAVARPLSAEIAASSAALAASSRLVPVSATVATVSASTATAGIVRIIQGTTAGISAISAVITAALAASATIASQTAASASATTQGQVPISAAVASSSLANVRASLDTTIIASVSSLSATAGNTLRIRKASSSVSSSLSTAAAVEVTLGAAAAVAALSSLLADTKRGSEIGALVATLSSLSAAGTINTVAGDPIRTVSSGGRVYVQASQGPTYVKASASNIAATESQDRLSSQLSKDRAFIKNSNDR